ncbi:tRNA pseudouridine(38-40) synthase TruA [Bacillus sp. CGMCC 1.16607]|uniref:tRNA pseudouridine(38-40) synthase TruA n=1 Tax=Bacillus sp. CGMCC 1.16607 TaxID=3351842 RepID=UPI00363D79C5
MQRLKCIISYDGTEFSGYQIQPNGRTVQEEVEKALKKLHKGQDIKIAASGRTDAGVHAKGQVIHFDTNINIPLEKWSIALNSLLPADISVIEAENVDTSFHARFDAKGKEYRYFVYPSKMRDPFRRNYATIFPYELNKDLIQEAMSLFIGTHDFTSFCSAKTEVEDKVRTIYEINICEENGLLVFRYVGNGFLYNMVRIMTGTLLEIGTGDRAANSISKILEKKDRSFAGKTAPAQGLYLWRVVY